MRWHKEGIHENDRVMGHPSDGEAGKVLDRFDADFASGVRNIRFGLVTYDFDSFSTNSTILLLSHLCCVVQPTTISLYEV
jgi:hypothetical protein